MDNELPQLPPEPSRSEPLEAVLPHFPQASAEPLQESYRDRSTGLVVFGIIQIVLSCFAFLFIPLALVGMLMSRRTGMAPPAASTVLTLVTYAMVAVGLLTLGIGSIRARRWAWTITLTLSWMWLVFGAVSTVALTVVLPRTFRATVRNAATANPDTPTMPNGVMAVVLTLLIAICAFFMVVLPIIFLAFYRRKDVESTVKHRDPVERWTDRCPVPVLAISFLFGGTAVYFVVLSVTMPIFALFGRYLTGVPAGICLFLLAGFDGLLAYGTYRLRTTWWWIAVVGFILRCASALVTFRFADLIKAYGKIGWSQQQLQMLSNNPMLNSRITIYWTVISGLLFVTYMIWVKKYFSSRVDQRAEVSLPPA